MRRVRKPDFKRTSTRYQSDCSHSNNSPNASNDNFSKRKKREFQCPGDLKGREIGLWYARRRKMQLFQMQNEVKDKMPLRRTMGETRSSECSSQGRDVDTSEVNSMTMRSSRPPPGLSGKEIGLWYAARNKMRVTHPCQVKQVITLNNVNCVEIENVLMKVENEKQVLPDDGLCTESSLSDIPTKIQELSLSHFQREYLRHKDETKLSDTSKIETHFPRCNLIKDVSFDNELTELYIKKLSSVKYVEMQKKRKQLPAYGQMEKIVQTVSHHQVVVITGETGCGKTTQVPQFILDSFINSGKGSLCHILCTQPRRISAISIAEWIAEERDECCGSGTVGYQIRLESKLPCHKGSILFCTTGIVLQYLQGDPYLKGTSHLILDEVHERNLQTDFLITIVKDLIVYRPDLKIILMSATVNAEAFSKYFGNCPILNIPGFTYPVQEYYLEDILEKTKYRVLNQDRKRSFKKKKFSENREYYDMKDAFLRNLEGRYSSHTITSLQNMDEEELDLELMKELIKHICVSQPDGAILVFLPGWTDISKLNNLLISDRLCSRSSFRIIPLHSMMPTINQRTVFERPPKGVRKIILATNIAETSITINDVVYVVDCGKIKMTNFDVENNISTLVPEWVSLANAHQRRGRAGRIQPGICYHMYTTLRENFLDPYQLPEIQRTRLEELCLQVKMLKLGKFEVFTQKAMDPPSSKAVSSAICLLKKLNAMDSEEMLTPLGYHLAKLPLDPQTGKMILFGAMFGCLDPILTVAASLSFKDAFVVPLGKEKEADYVRKKLSKGLKSDHLMLIIAYNGWQDSKRNRCESSYCRDNFLSRNTLTMLQKMKDQLAKYLFDSKMIDSPDPKSKYANVNSDNTNLIRAVICAGLYPNVALLRMIEGKHYSRRPPPMRTKEDGNVNFHLKSVNSRECQFESPWLVYHLKLKSTGIFLHDTTMVLPLPLIFFGGEVAFATTNEGGVLKVDQYMTFHCNDKIADLILKLRAELDIVLDHKINNPGTTEWNLDTQEGAIMRAIVDLITSEEALTVRNNEQ